MGTGRPIRSSADERAFTLLEILIVVGLIALVGAAFLPNLGTPLGFHIDSAARVVKAELDYTGQRAIATGAVHRWQIDLDSQRFRIERVLEKEFEEAAELPEHADLLDLSPPEPSIDYVPIPETSGSWRRLKEGVRIDAVWLAEEQIREGEIGIAFSPDGAAEPAEIWLLEESGLEKLIRIVGFTGEVFAENASREF